VRSGSLPAERRRLSLVLGEKSVRLQATVMKRGSPFGAIVTISASLYYGMVTDKKHTPVLIVELPRYTWRLSWYVWIWSCLYHPKIVKLLTKPEQKVNVYL
jgi:hypothetical protein